MSNELKQQYLSRVRSRYFKSNKKQKSLIIDEFCQVCDISRKHAIRLLNEDSGAVPPRPGPKPFYGPDVREHIVILWQAMNRMCSKKMVAAMPIWLEYYDVHDHIKLLLKRISASTIDRILTKHREEWRKGRLSTEPSLIKNKIPIQLLDHEIKEPGFIEADTVAHCGTSLAGEFINTMTMTDIFSGWTENRAMWKKESQTVIAAIKSIEIALPFEIKGFASDNGNEFLNHDLHSYFFDRKNRVHFVRRRPYQKNDNAHVEQKNWTHVRELFAYERFEAEAQVESMNEIYERLWNPLWNYFTPVMKLKTKTRIGGKIIKVYDEIKTPYQRLIDSGVLKDWQVAVLQENFKKLNPFSLKKELENKLKWFNRLVEIRSKSSSRAG
jgi:hypothetical protein